MARGVIAAVAASILISLGSLGAAGTADAATTVPLVLSQSAALSILGHSCGGIQEQVYATGFVAPHGYPAGDVYMRTRCGGSGRGGGYKTTTYAAWATVVWDWVGDTRSFARLEGAAEGISTTFSAEDAYGDHLYNVGTAAYLETTAPPVVAPEAPTGVTAEFSTIEVGEGEEEPVRRFLVSWTPAPETAGLITSSTVTATPVGSTAPVLTATTSGGASTAVIEPLQRHTTYVITVTSSDDEGTSPDSSPIEARSESSPPPPPPAVETCEQNTGTIKLSPGLEETPHVQSITVKGQLKGCDGSLSMSEGSYTAHLTTTEAVGCSSLTDPFVEPAATPVSLAVKWAPKEAGSSTGTLVMPLTEAGGSLGGTLEGGPFTEPLSMSAGSVYESFTGGPTCGVPAGRKAKAKAVKDGTFTSAAVEIGG